MASRLGRYAAGVAATGLVAVVCTAGASAQAATNGVAAHTAAPVMGRTAVGRMAAQGAAHSGELVLSHPVAGRDGCGAVRAHLAQYAARGVKQVTCMSVGAAKTKKTTPLATLPSLCKLDAEIYSRFDDCVYIPWTGTVVNTQTGAVIGTAAGTFALWNALAWNSRSWNENISIGVTSATGAAADGSLNAPIQCLAGVVPEPSDCSATGTGSWAGQLGQLPLEDGAQYSGELGFHSSTSATVQFGFEVIMTLSAPDATPGSVPVPEEEPIRCDSKSLFSPTSGCVYPNAPGDFLEAKSDPKVTEAANFMADAQQSIPTHPGLDGKGKALTRMTDAASMKKNSMVACKKVHPKKGQSCDEYPFASTHQGAAFVPAADFRAEALNAAQNSQVGNDLKDFYLVNRIMDGNPFYVTITATR